MTKLEKLRNEFGKLGIDAMLVNSEFNRRYISNFTGSAGSVLISADRALFITDFRYIEQASKQCEGFEIVDHNGFMEKEVAEQAKKLGVKKLGFEKDHVTFGLYKEYEKEFEGELVPVGGAIEKLRLIKTDAEIKILKEAAEVADAAFTHILKIIRPGITELDVSNELESFMRKAGAASSSFDIIVASGYRSALPHGVASEKVIEAGGFFTLDF